MLNERYIRLLAERYRAGRPYWFPDAWLEQAHILANSLCRELVPLVQGWLDTGVESDLRVGEFSILDIAALTGTDYLGAIELMNAYILDPAEGRMRIRPF